MEAIELGVHEGNQRAKALCERLDFKPIRTLDELGFEVMQKRLA